MGSRKTKWSQNKPLRVFRSPKTILVFQTAAQILDPSSVFLWLPETDVATLSGKCKNLEFRPETLTSFLISLFVNTYLSILSTFKIYSELNFISSIPVLSLQSKLPSLHQATIITSLPFLLHAYICPHTEWSGHHCSAQTPLTASGQNPNSPHSL